MSETGSGDIRDMRQRIAWAARSADLNPKPYEIGRWLRDMSALGHAEIDWQNGRWAVAPAAAVLIPQSGGTAVLAGARRTGLVDRIEGCDDLAVHMEERPSAFGQPLPPPPSIYVQAESLPQLNAALEALGINYAGAAAGRIARGLRRIDLDTPAAPPAWSDDVEHLLPHSDDLRFVTGLPHGDGLCRTTVQGRPSYSYRRGDSWFRTDHATGILYALAAQKIGVIRWRRDRVSDGEEIGTVFVDQGAPLPPLQSRALVLCSGLPTKFGQTARTAIYSNVPLDVAKLVGESVRQKVTQIA
ncbi:hypothetical protein ABTX24_07345 [Nocardioides sp. NPDC127514]|uniref:hypothetical protein n=1 Tax=unclassified Nocardioides TaxID=2615069 RepID=UPI00333327E0